MVQLGLVLFLGSQRCEGEEDIKLEKYCQRLILLLLEIFNCLLLQQFCALVVIYFPAAPLVFPKFEKMHLAKGE